jgi:iron donor protein CyaY
LRNKTLSPGAAKIGNNCMDEQEFKRRADASLESLYKTLTKAPDDAGFEVDFNSGALAIEFEEPPGKFVISPNTPVRQIWVSAHSRSFKLDWNEALGNFVLPETGETLPVLIENAISKQLGSAR